MKTLCDVKLKAFPDWVLHKQVFAEGFPDWVLRKQIFVEGFKEIPAWILRKTFYKNVPDKPLDFR